MADVVNIEALCALPVAERLRLIELILSTLEEDSAEELTPAQKAEVDRRIQHWRENPDSAISHEEFRARLRTLM